MKTVTGVLATRADAEHVAGNLESIGVSRNRVTLLFPGEPGATASVPVSPTEQPGMGKALGGVVGAAVGTAGGAHAGMALAAAIPGVGPVFAIGALASVVLGAAGAGVGVAAGGALENATTTGLPEDELFVYEDALRKGRSVIIVTAEDDDSAEAIRQFLTAEGAESVDAARQQWWIGLRSAEQEHYSPLGRNFNADEQFYRMGFEAALHARNRCKEYDQMLTELVVELEELKRRYPHDDVEEPFRRGYQRGREYYQNICNQVKAA
ncbi:MAG: hypothetical protein HYX72_14045 [Acidobacteria bacterium]|nr:hypothetical protein [Acidobacteriota bacterium]